MMLVKRPGSNGSPHAQQTVLAQVFSNLVFQEAYECALQEAFQKYAAACRAPYLQDLLSKSQDSNMRTIAPRGITAQVAIAPSTGIAQISEKVELHLACRRW